jgi:hypothetical protein
MPSLESCWIYGERRSWRGGGKSVFNIEVPVLVVVAVLVEDMVVVPVEYMEEVSTKEMVVVKATFSLHELHDSAVVVSFF